MVVSREPVACRQLMQQFPQLFIDSLGDLNRTIKGVTAPKDGSPEFAVFLATPTAIEQGFNSRAKVLCISLALKAKAETLLSDHTILIANNVELAMAAVIKAFFLTTPYTNRDQRGIHPSAVIVEGARLSAGVRVGPNAFIGRGVEIGSHCYIGANSVIEDDVVLGEGCVIHPLVFIGHSTIIGKNCEIHPNSVIGKEGFGYAHDERFNHYRIPHVGRVVIEDDVHIGSHVSIDRATFGETRIFAGAKLDNQIQIGHNSSIGRNSILTSGFSVAGSTRIGANFLAGGKSSVTGHIEVCDNVQIAALSAISKTMTEPGQYAGVPLVPIKSHIKMKAALVHLPEMRRQLSRILKKLGLEDES